MSNEVVNKSIYDKIIEKGSLDAQEILNLGEKKAKSIEDSIINEANDDANKLIENNRRLNQDKLRTKTTEFERLAKREILFKKKELIDSLFVKVAEKLNRLDDKELFGFVKNYILNESIQGNELIKVSANEYKRYLTLFSSDKASDLVVLDKLNKELGKDYNLKLSNKPVSIDGGFIIISENFDIDLSYKSILNIIKEKEETEIANILYKEDN